MDRVGSELVGFKPHLRVAAVPGEAVYLISERGMTVLSGPCAERLAGLLDGTRSIAELEHEVSGVWPAAGSRACCGGCRTRT